MQQNWIDRSLSYVAPRYALQRVKARTELLKSSAPAPVTQKRSYEGAEGYRRGGGGGNYYGGGIFAATTSADTEIFSAARALRDRSRDLVRNNPHAAKAVDALVRNIVGNGINPRVKMDDKDKAAKIMAAFSAWSNNAECDTDGRHNFASLQQLVCREMIEGGEVLIRRLVSKGYDQEVPLRLQLMEADQLDSYRNGVTDNNSMIRQGVEVVSSGPHIGERLAYWLFPHHPGDLFFNAQQTGVSAPVDASEILHIYEARRIQVRGTPWGEATFRTLADLHHYEQAELMRKQMESCNVAIVTTQDDSELGINPERANEPFGDNQAGAFDCHGNPIERFEPGMIIYAQNGKTVAFNSPASVGGYNEYKVSQLRTIAAGWRVPYEILSGDLSQTNYSSLRGGSSEFRRLVGSVQRQIFVPMFLQPVWNWFCECAFLAGVIDTPVVAVEWSFPRFEYVNPLEDVQADLTAIRSGERSWEEVVAGNGRDPDVVWAEIVAFQERARRDGVILDSDPSAVSGRGVAQKNEPGQSPTKTKPKKSNKKAASLAQQQDDASSVASDAD